MSGGGYIFLVHFFLGITVVIALAICPVGDLRVDFQPCFADGDDVLVFLATLEGGGVCQVVGEGAFRGLHSDELRAAVDGLRHDDGLADRSVSKEMGAAVPLAVTVTASAAVALSKVKLAVGCVFSTCKEVMFCKKLPSPAPCIRTTSTLESRWWKLRVAVVVGGVRCTFSNFAYTKSEP